MDALLDRLQQSFATVGAEELQVIIGDRLGLEQDVDPVHTVVRPAVVFVPAEDHDLSQISVVVTRHEPVTLYRILELAVDLVLKLQGAVVGRDRSAVGVVEAQVEGEIGVGGSDGGVFVVILGVAVGEVLVGRDGELRLLHFFVFVRRSVFFTTTA